MSRPIDVVGAARSGGWEVVLGGVMWMSTLVYFVGQAIAQAAWKTPYSLVDNPISDLGNTACGQWPPASAGSQLAERLGAGSGYVCSPLHSVMNVSFVAAGVLLLLGLYFTRRQWPSRRRSTWGFVSLTLAGLGKIVVGLVPENSSLLLHELGGLGSLMSIIGVLLFGLAVWQTRRRVAVFSVEIAALGLLGILGSFAAPVLGHGHGASERVEMYPVFVWMFVLGLSLVWANWSVVKSRAIGSSRAGGVLRT
jgi:hypothetical protein